MFVQCGEHEFLAMCMRRWVLWVEAVLFRNTGLSLLESKAQLSASQLLGDQFLRPLVYALAPFW